MLEGNPEIQYRQALSENSICQEIKQESAYATPEMLFKKRKKENLPHCKRNNWTKREPTRCERNLLPNVKEMFLKTQKCCCWGATLTNTPVLSFRRLLSATEHTCSGTWGIFTLSAMFPFLPCVCLFAIWLTSMLAWLKWQSLSPFLSPLSNSLLSAAGEIYSLPALGFFFFLQKEKLIKFSQRRNNTIHNGQIIWVNTSQKAQMANLWGKNSIFSHQGDRNQKCIGIPISP